MARRSFDEAEYETVPWPATEATSGPIAADDGKLFDITCVVGSVYRNDASGFTPREVAFLMIARAGHDGEFHFPSDDGLDICVAVASDVASR